jgi:indolepyruvate ferredoxin oxidoreductase beta subunit
MKCDIVLAGVGGQGILSIAAVLGRAALSQGLQIKQAEVHGMAQRGGAVQSHFRMSDHPIHSDVIASGQADMILSMEPMEALRYITWLKDDGWLISNDQPVENIAVYPELEKLHEEIRAVKNHVLFNGTALATENGSARALNMAMLGAASPFINIGAEILEEAIHQQFAGKPEKIIETNITVFRAARAVAEAHK